MANRTATLYIRIIKNGKDSFRKPVYQFKGRLKPQYAIVNGEPEHHKEGVYHPASVPLSAPAMVRSRTSTATGLYLAAVNGSPVACSLIW